VISRQYPKAHEKAENQLVSLEQRATDTSKQQKAKLFDDVVAAYVYLLMLLGSFDGLSIDLRKPLKRELVHWVYIGQVGHREV
jgi:hypothetical protein